MYQSSGKEKENCCFVFLSSAKPEIRHFHVAVVQRRLTSEQKRRDVRAELLFCRSKTVGFLPFSLPLPSSLLKLPDMRLTRRELLDTANKQYYVKVYVKRYF